MFKKLFRRNTAVKSPISIAISKYSLPVNTDIKLHSSEYSIYTISVIKLNILSYNILLETVIEKMKYNQIISYLSLGLDKRDLYLQTFFIDDKGYYVDINALDRFKQLSGEFLTLYKECEELPIKNFTTEKNLSVTQDIVTNLLTMLETLIDLNIIIT